MYGSRISVPTDEEVQTVFENYVADAKQRLASNQLKPGENVTLTGSASMEESKLAEKAVVKASTGAPKPGAQSSITGSEGVRVSGQVAVMQINAGIARVIFDHNP